MEDEYEDAPEASHGGVVVSDGSSELFNLLLEILGDAARLQVLLEEASPEELLACTPRFNKLRDMFKIRPLPKAKQPKEEAPRTIGFKGRKRKASK
jgi:hypothetical protein